MPILSYLTKPSPFINTRQRFYRAMRDGTVVPDAEGKILGMDRWKMLLLKLDMISDEGKKAVREALPPVDMIPEWKRFLVQASWPARMLLLNGTQLATFEASRWPIGRRLLIKGILLAALVGMATWACVVGSQPMARPNADLMAEMLGALLLVMAMPTAWLLHGMFGDVVAGRTTHRARWGAIGLPSTAVVAALFVAGFSATSLPERHLERRLVDMRASSEAFSKASIERKARASRDTSYDAVADEYAARRELSLSMGFDADRIPDLASYRAGKGNSTEASRWGRPTMVRPDILQGTARVLADAFHVR